MAFEQFLDRGSVNLTVATTSSSETSVVLRRPARQPAVADPGSRAGGRDLLIRVVDLVIATAALIFISPLLVVIAGLCKLQDGGPVIFAQSRCGRDGRFFKCLKFRSMVTDADVRLQTLLQTDPAALAEWTATHKLLKDPRVTPLGDFLRKSSLDELPQLINVIRGEMSLVGPRPIVAGEIGRYGRYMANYNTVLPGITGLWQVSGRSDTNYRRRVALDVMYIRKRSLGLYLYILFMTVPAVLLRKGAR